MCDTGCSVANINMSHLHEFEYSLCCTVDVFPSEHVTVFDAVVSAVLKKRFPEDTAAISDLRRAALHVRTHNLRAEDCNLCGP